MGSIGRYWLAGIVQAWGGIGFPAGTLAVNVIGSFVVGLVMTLSIERAILGPDARLLLAVGACGGFTTMSTFSYETLALVRDGELAMACANAGASLCACLLAVWAGTVVGRSF
jgi:CrcB protein